MRERPGAWHVPHTQRSTHFLPGLEFQSEARGGYGDVAQHRLTSFLLGQPYEAPCICAWRGEQLGGRAQQREIVGMFPKAKRHTQFFVAKTGVVGGQCWIKITLVVGGSAFNRALEQPERDLFRSAVAQRSHLSQQRRHMRDVAQPPGECRGMNLFSKFHGGTVKNKNCFGD